MRYLKAPLMELDVVENRLTVNGAPVHLGGKAFFLLRALMERPQQLLTKDELIDIVWEGRSVSDAVLTTAMKELRKALDDPARAPVFIETVHGRGYRFLAPVEAVAPPDDLARPKEPSVNAGALSDSDCEQPERPKLVFLYWWAAAAVLFVIVILYSTIFRTGETAESVLTAVAPAPEETVAAPHPKSIAVLPFLDLSPGGDHEWFTDGLSEELITSLTRTPDLLVASRTSSFRFKGDDIDIRRAAHDMGVALILEGSVRRSGDRIRVTAQLIDANDGVHLWSRNYDRNYDDIIAIQEDIAFEIATAMRTVTDPEKLQAMVDAGTRSVEAYEAMLYGHHFRNQELVTGDLEIRRRAHEEYERARSIDPNFSAAHWLAAQYWFEGPTFMLPPSEKDRHSAQQISNLFEERVNAAISTASENTMAQLYSAALYAHRMNYRAAHRFLGDYVADRPRDAYAWVMRVSIAVNVADFDAAREAAHALAALVDETSLHFPRTISNLMWARDFEGAEQQARLALKLSPDNPFVQYLAHGALLWNGKTNEAREILVQIEASDLSEYGKNIAALRQTCADGDLPGAASLADSLRSQELAPISIQWMTEMLMDRTDAANAILIPYDRSGDLHQLADFLIYPHFDSRPFRLLSSKLTAEDIERPRVLPLPYACSAPA